MGGGKGEMGQNRFVEGLSRTEVFRKFRGCVSVTTCESRDTEGTPSSTVETAP